MKKKIIWFYVLFVLGHHHLRASELYYGENSFIEQPEKKTKGYELAPNSSTKSSSTANSEGLEKVKEDTTSTKSK